MKNATSRGFWFQLNKPIILKKTYLILIWWTINEKRFIKVMILEIHKSWVFDTHFRAPFPTLHLPLASCRTIHRPGRQASVDTMYIEMSQCRKEGSWYSPLLSTLLRKGWPAPASALCIHPRGHWLLAIWHADQHPGVFKRMALNLASLQRISKKMYYSSCRYTRLVGVARLSMYVLDNIMRYKCETICFS